MYTLHTLDVTEEDNFADSKAEFIHRIQPGNAMFRVSGITFFARHVESDPSMMEIFVPMRDLWECYFDCRKRWTRGLRIPFVI